MLAPRILLILFASVSLAHAQGSGRVVYWSPDESLQAIVNPTVKDRADFGEYSVEIKDSKGDLLTKEDYSSPDHEHGRSILKAGWSPDSQFFVFSTASSGGHSAWHVPTFAYARKENRIFYLDDFVGGSLVDKDFYFTSPALFHSKRNNWKDEVQIAEEPLPIEIDLNSIDLKGI